MTPDAINWLSHRLHYRYMFTSMTQHFMRYVSTVEKYSTKFLVGSSVPGTLWNFKACNEEIG